MASYIAALFSGLAGGAVQAVADYASSSPSEPVPVSETDQKTNEVAHKWLLDDAIATRGLGGGDDGNVCTNDPSAPSPPLPDPAQQSNENTGAPEANNDPSPWWGLINNVIADVVDQRPGQAMLEVANSPVAQDAVQTAATAVGNTTADVLSEIGESLSKEQP